ncbi:Rpn family recombination-promoting nuclease/putative transposase [Ligilactobacillus salivarius]|uniref:Rpn family recombination-promoting nuclease/putative transposase n=2 Tax=Ligilactobacillus salivarius TaxID=1624 RepID=C2EIE1_9LACO|nr:Rpn family recombination-promoting nuclease/putative transposase [Ligilactobacillus salivarius]ATP38307.1 hypothetical protein CR531_09095 [Ligilactobacillus salivarius]EEJ73669.1 hypothetical protein HMPREF0545_1413 [Ligilactobacillus salivarius DSM 20555 = ATCC 11741]KRM69041.1 hypothetical protein FC55_GL000418 [Ligilactobacillus salivarius DSM 20555 = ATCC 11741]MBE7938410.1 Rpn family recombination-promoting nuclease/putative transposase [Ligilactobacillus salivarius]MDG9755565.1 Rpn f
MNSKERKRLSEEKWRKATFKDGVIFAWVVADNEDICLKLLQIILPELNIANIVKIRNEDSRKKNKIFHGVRFDVFAEDEQGRMYDIEMQIANNHDLGQRMSYYQSNLVSRSVRQGQSFVSKVDTYVIFICDFDFGKQGLPKYTTNLVINETGEVIDNKEHNIVLNIRAKDFSSLGYEVNAFLEYVKSNKISNQLTKNIDDKVKELKKSTERKKSYMVYEQELLTREYYAEQKGLQKGLQKGREEGKKEGRKENIIDSIKKLDSQGYDKKQIIDSITAVTAFTAEEISQCYDEIMVK